VWYEDKEYGVIVLSKDTGVLSAVVGGAQVTGRQRVGVEKRGRGGTKLSNLELSGVGGVVKGTKATSVSVLTRLQSHQCGVIYLPAHCSESGKTGIEPNECENSVAG
jgi:hypothetical protein